MFMQNLFAGNFSMNDFKAEMANSGQELVQAIKQMNGDLEIETGANFIEFANEKIQGALFAV